MPTFGIVVVEGVEVELEVVVGEVVFLREFRRPLTVFESTAVPNVFRNWL